MELKKTEKFYFSVEGETEKWYLEHVQSLINKSETSINNAKIHCKVCRPSSYIKTLGSLYKPSVFHICDYEEDDEEHIKLFHSIIDEIKNVKKIKSVDYKLNYSNFTFELWIICHKKALIAPKTDRTQYLQPINELFEESFTSLDEYKKEKNFKLFLTKHIKTIDDIVTATKNAKAIRENHLKNGDKVTEYAFYKYYRNNPDLDMFECIEKILKKCGCI